MVEPRFAAEAATPEARRALHEQNRLSWNEATRAHNSHKADQARFYREGGNTLGPEEAALLGDLAGKSVVHLFHWGTSEVISALLDAGLVLEHFREYDHCTGFQPFKGMKDLGEGRWTVPDGKPSIPFMYSLVARKPG